MNLHLPLISNKFGTASNMFKQDVRTPQAWIGHVAHYLKDAHKMLGQNPHAAMAVIVCANTIFFFVVNAAIKELEKRSADSEGEVNERSYKHIFASGSFTAGCFYAFNFLLSKATNFQFTHVALAMITATAMTVRIVMNRVLFRQATDQAEKEIVHEADVPSIQKKAEILDLEEVLMDSPGKSPIETQSSQDEVAKLRVASMKERVRADQLQNEKSAYESKIAVLESNILGLENAKKKLEKDKKEERIAAKNLHQEIARLQVAKKDQRVNAVTLSKQIEQLESELMEATVAKEKLELDKEELEHDKEMISRDVNLLQEQKNEANQMRLKAEKKLANANKKLGVAEDEIQEIRQKNIQMEEEKKSLFEKFQELKQLLTELQADAAHFEEQESDINNHFDDMFETSDDEDMIPQPNKLATPVKPSHSPHKPPPSSPLKQKIDQTIAKASKILL